MVKFRLLMAVILNLTVNTAIILRTAYFLRQLLKLIETPGSSYESQVVYVMMITFCSVIRTTTFSGTFSLGSLAGIQVRAGVLSLVFKRIMYQRMHYTTVGNLVNLCANDGQRLYEALLHAAFAVSAIPVIGASIYAVHLLGPWGIFGFVVFFAFIPFQTFLSRLVFAFRQVTIPITEERVKLMSEIITAVKLVKMYAWETSFAKKIYGKGLKIKIRINGI
ncbi:ABCC5 [Bugula neritina]|uniref:ABCC5 n=1 Tax=Bugula neritina TaxID=10212 RepID=A0A7J7JGM6_BUGNE|nr:ABCC5 [Bugula neritina]